MTRERREKETKDYPEVTELIFWNVAHRIRVEDRDDSHGVNNRIWDSESGLHRPDSQSRWIYTPGCTQLRRLGSMCYRLSFLSDSLTARTREQRTASRMQPRLACQGSSARSGSVNINSFSCSGTDRKSTHRDTLCICAFTSFKPALTLHASRRSEGKSGLRACL